MKKGIKILSAILIVFTIMTISMIPAYGFNQEHLNQLLSTGRCWKCDLSGVNLSGKSLWRLSLWNSNMSGANLSGAVFRFSDFTLVNLSGANLSNADLSETRLNSANLTGADLTGADLVWATWTDGKSKCRPGSIGKCIIY